MTTTRRVNKEKPTSKEWKSWETFSSQTPVPAQQHTAGKEFTTAGFSLKNEEFRPNIYHSQLLRLHLRCWAPNHLALKGNGTLHIIGVPEGKEKEAESFFEEIMAENFPNLRKQIPRHRESIWSVSNKMSLNQVPLN